MDTTDASHEPSILFLHTTLRVPDGLVECIEQDTEQPVIAVSNFDRARTELASNPVDCLLLNIDPIDDTGQQFVDDALTIAPDTPIILLTTQGPETISENLLSQVTTIVEQADDPDNWAFLVEKIRSARRSDGPKYEDYQQYRTLVESARDGLYRLDANGDVVYANESWAEMLGYRRGEILGIHASKAMADGELERGQRVIQELLEADDRDSDIMDMEMVTKDGDRIIVSIRFVVLTTDDGAYDGIVGVARDVTERRARERELERKNERLEQFASIVSHDLRNPLMTADGYLELAREDGEEEDFDRVAESLDRMNRIIEDMLWLAREGRELGATDLVDFEEQVMTTWRIVTGEGSDAALVTPDEGLGEIRADEDRLCQLLENLFRNAIDHGGAGVTVRVERTQGGFAVADDGPGVPVDDRESIFERGFTTGSDGTGFGLAIVEEIVNAHGWDIRVFDSDLGGACFEITTDESGQADT